MNFKRVAAGILAAATVFTASAATFQGGVTLFSQTALTAEAALNDIAIYYSGDIYACNNIKYKLNKSTKEAVIYGKTPKNPGGGNVTLTDVVIPGQIRVQKGDFAGTYKVTAIAEKAFKGCELTSIDLRNCWAMKKIYNEAFMNCKKLKTVRLSSSVENMYSSGFQGCTALTTFDFNGNSCITDMPIYFFQGCTALKSVSIPYSVTWIRDGAFSSSGLTSVKVSNNVTNVSSSAFAGCKNLKTVTFEAGSSKKLTLGRYAFANCPKISAVNFDREQYTAYSNTFEGCGDSFKSYGYGAQNYTQAVAKDLLGIWGLKYNGNASVADQKKFFNDLKHQIHVYITYKDLENFEEGNAATVVSIRKGTCGGYARVFYNFCIAAGVPANRVLVGGNSCDHAWNYVKIKNYWYNVDATGDYDVCDKQTFYDKYQSGSDPYVNDAFGPRYPHRPSGWTVCLDDNIGSDDNKNYTNPRVVLFDKLLAENGYEYNITGTRA